MDCTLVFAAVALAAEASSAGAGLPPQPCRVSAITPAPTIAEAEVMFWRIFMFFCPCAVVGEFWGDFLSEFWSGVRGAGGDGLSRPPRTRGIWMMRRLSAEFPGSGPLRAAKRGASGAAPAGAPAIDFGATSPSPAFADVTSLPAGVSTGRSITPNSETLAFPYLILLYTANVVFALNRSRLVIPGLLCR